MTVCGAQGPAVLRNHAAGREGKFLAPKSRVVRAGTALDGVAMGVLVKLMRHINGKCREARDSDGSKGESKSVRRDFERPRFNSPRGYNFHI